MKLSLVDHRAQNRQTHQTKTKKKKMSFIFPSTVCDVVVRGNNSFTTFHKCQRKTGPEERAIFLLLVLVRSFVRSFYL